MQNLLTPESLKENPFELIGKEWMLITAGSEEKINTMTASYGSLGILFGKKVAQIYVRPERYTYQFLEDQPYFSLSFFSEDFRSILSYCGKMSGKDIDKIKECGLHSGFTSEGAPYFEEAKLTLICKKIYAQDLNREFLLDEEICKNVYGSGGDHRMYVGEIISIIRK